MRGRSGKHGPRPLDEGIEALARRQHGVLSRCQLFDLGMGQGAIQHRLKTGRLHPIFRGVYLVGTSLLPPLAREMAAVLACGRGALLSHWSAAYLWKLLSSLPRSQPLTVTIPGRTAAIPGIRSHRVPEIHPRDRRSHRGIPVTSPARTFLDIAADLSMPELEQAVAHAKHRNIVRISQLEDVLERHSRRRGAGPLRRLIDSGKPSLTRSPAERKLLTLIRAAGLPEPETNVLLHGYEIDFLWREQGVAIEVDGYAYHSDRSSFDADRLRDARLQAFGITTTRVTTTHLSSDPDGVITRLRAALGR